MKKFFIALTVLVLGIFLGFSNSDNPLTKTNLANKNISAPIVTDNNNPNSTQADYYLDDFNAPNDTAGLRARGYLVYRNGTFSGVTPPDYWFTGNPAVFPAFNGDPNDYVGSNFQSAGTLGDIDNWLILPALNVMALDSICFRSRAPLASTFPDTIKVMYNPLGGTLPSSPGWVELGKFKVNTAGVWELRSFVIPSTQAGARLAIRYSVVDGGFNGANSDYIGIDALRVQGRGVYPDVYTINVTLSGAQEVPPVATPGTGTLTGTYNQVTNIIDFSVSFSGLVSPTNNAHFHAPAPRGVNAPVVIGFVPGFPLGVTSGIYDSTFTLTAGQETQLLAGLFYVNIHTVVNPGGEIRAQLDSIGSSSTLPVELSSFASNVLNNNVTLNWSTATETNNSGFDIERSIVNGQWSKIGNVTGNGTVTTPKNYSFTDRGLNVGTYNYRLKQIDLNGNFKYFNLSNEVEIGIPNRFELSQNYPNPFNPSTIINYQLPSLSNVKLSIYDISGKEVKSLVNGKQEAGYYTFELNASGLSSGIYFYTLTTDNSVETKKMLLVK